NGRPLIRWIFPARSRSGLVADRARSGERRGRTAFDDDAVVVIGALIVLEDDRIRLIPLTGVEEEGIGLIETQRGSGIRVGTGADQNLLRPRQSHRIDESQLARDIPGSPAGGGNLDAKLQPELTPLPDVGRARGRC